MENREKKAQMMGAEPIKLLLLKLAMPAIVGMLISAVYNIVDTIFVGKLGTSAIGAASVAYPLFMLISAVGLMYGVGSASYISRLLGKGAKEKADEVTSTTFITSLLSGLLLTAVVMIFLEPILTLFGATETIMPYALEYSEVLVMGATFTVLNMTMNNILRAEGNAKFSMIALSVGAILNIILDPLFIFTFNMGIRGAAVATVVSQVTSTLMLLSFFTGGKSYVKLKLKLVNHSLENYREIFKIGIPTFLRQFLMSLGMGLLNTAAMPYGDAALASIGVTNRVFSLAAMVLFGYSQGFQPVAGYNYGAKRFDRLSESIKLSLKWTTLFSIASSFIYMVFAESIIGVFSQDSEVIRIGTMALRAMALLFPLFGFQIVYATLFQALGRGKEAAILSLSRQGIFFYPAVFVLPKLFGLHGVLLSQPFADVCTVLLTAYFAVKINKEIKEMYHMIPVTEVA